MSNYKAVFHVDESSKWGLVFKNILNTLAAQETVEMVVVANAEAVKEYASGGQLVEQMTKLNAQGVVFFACNNALKSFEVDLNKIPEFVKIIPAGIVELVKRQNERYAYIKP